MKLKISLHLFPWLNVTFFLNIFVKYLHGAYCEVTGEWKLFSDCQNQAAFLWSHWKCNEYADLKECVIEDEIATVLLALRSVAVTVEQSPSWGANCLLTGQEILRFFMEPGSSSPCSQQLTARPCPMSDEHSPHPHTLFI